MAEERTNHTDELGLKRARKVMKVDGFEGLLALWQIDELAFGALISHVSYEARKTCGDFGRMVPGGGN